ncbi:MAG: hypothetical protein N4A57_15760 [Anaeromicrobium sp.]|jgi:hypothetical protein|uniref:hypothetical protein n=1 Tax=Anaeromicrobium sp. TaxID=1929132 RepID=UPI0025CF43AC|nr:hypothetical protein [Anaeromicrobium sp.]MCT4595704.1 hypothetical protein [Anaeromicrobium sp.]
MKDVLIKIKGDSRIRCIFNILIILRITLVVLGVIFNMYLLGSSTMDIIDFIILFVAFIVVSKSDVNKLIGRYILLSILIMVNIFWSVWYGDKVEYYFKSPNGKNTLVVSEEPVLMLGVCELYERKYLIFKKRLGGSPLYTDDGYRPFSNYDYKIEWVTEKEAIIFYGYGSGSRSCKEKVKFK